MSRHGKAKTARVTPEVDPGDLNRIVAAFNDGKLADFGVVALDVAERPDVDARCKHSKHVGKHRAKDVGRNPRQR